jgi:solute carrier family 13 (sodium-dependent dicarboxylate transporter), member 2/3/5
MNSSQLQPVSKTKWVGFFGGLILFVLILMLPEPEGLSPQGWRTAAVALLMATWWITEIIPISATALLPLVLFPMLGIADIGPAAQPYANPMIFLFMGGFILAIAMQKWGLHRRVALNIIWMVGAEPRNIIVGFMIATALMSMWVSNTAAAMMMLPIALSVIDLTNAQEDPNSAQRKYQNFGIVLMLIIAYAASIGGLATIIGTPTNALLVGFVSDSYGVEISFLQWMMMGVPIVVLGLPILYYAMTYLVFPIRLNILPGGKEFVRDELGKLGKISLPETIVAIVFSTVALLWITRPLLEDYLPGLTDAGIAIFGAIVLFLIPIKPSEGKFLLDWKSAERLPWGVLILFGGGLSLAGAINRTGLAEWIGGYFAYIGGWPVFFVILVAAMVIIMFTELASNSATAAAFLPIMASVAIGIGQDPLILAIPVAIVASCAFMLPAATPPNAIIYGSGVVTIPQMARAGLVLNVLFGLLITLLTYYLFTWILGIQII